MDRKRRHSFGWDPRTLSPTPAPMFCGPGWLPVFIRLCPGGGDVCDTASPLCSSTSLQLQLRAYRQKNVATSDYRASKLVCGCIWARGYCDKPGEDMLTLNMLAKHVISLLCPWNFHSKHQQKSQIWIFFFCLFSSLFELIPSNAALMCSLSF